MSFTWATVDRDFSDRPHYLHKSLSHLWGRKIYYDFTKNDNEHTLEVLETLQSHFIFMYRGDSQWSDLTNGGLFNQSQREDYQIVRYKGVILLWKD